MITRLLTLLVVWLSCFSYSNAQTHIGEDPNALNLGDDAWSAVQLGFDVNYFGQTFDQITIYNNGMAKFGNNGQYVQNCCNGYIPTQEQHDYSLFPLWTDLITINNNTSTGLQGVYYLSDNTDTFQIAWIDIQEFYNADTSNTFGIEIKSTSDGALIDFFYDGIDIRGHDVWSGLTGDISEGEVVENFFHRQSDGALTGGSELDFSWNQSGYINCSNPLNDPSCEGYEKAYLDQQCSANVLYDPQCPGYEQAYLDYQCSLDQLYDTSCPFYDQAKLDRQCRIDSQYDTSCPGYVFEIPTIETSRFDNTTFTNNDGSDQGSTDDGSTFERFNEPVETSNAALPLREELTGNPYEEEIETIEELVILEEILEEIEVISDLEIIEEETEEEREENVVVATETLSEEASDEGETTQTRRSGSRVGLSVGLGTANSLVSSLISRSIESGMSNSAQGMGSGGFYGSSNQNMANLMGSGAGFDDLTNSNTNDTQNEQDLDATLTVGASIPLGFSLDVNNSQPETKKEPSLAEKMAERVRKKNLDNQKGIFNKQISILEGIASASNLNNYYERRLADASSWYGTEQIYPKNSLTDKNKSFYRLNSENYGTMQQLIRSQY